MSIPLEMKKILTGEWIIFITILLNMGMSKEPVIGVFRRFKSMLS
jgi:hypothetical protein